MDLELITPTAPIPPPLGKAYWVVPERLMAGAFPGAEDPREAQGRLQALLGQGVRHLINLMQPGEIDRFGRPFRGYDEPLRAAARAMGCEVTFARLPVKDMGVPGRTGMVRILDAVDRELALGRPVYVHCLGGIGRTGTVVGCYLVRHGLATGHTAVRTLAALRRHTALGHLGSPETAAQIEMVTSWVEGE
jgi:hypothetical protein